MQSKVKRANTARNFTKNVGLNICGCILDAFSKGRHFTVTPAESGLVHQCSPYVRLFVCLTVAKMKNAIFSKIKQFRAMVSTDDL